MIIRLLITALICKETLILVSCKSLGHGKMKLAFRANGQHCFIFPCVAHEVCFVAKEQGEVQKKFDALKQEVDKRDQDIKQLQRSLKDAENILVSMHSILWHGTPHVILFTDVRIFSLFENIYYIYYIHLGLKLDSATGNWSMAGNGNISSQAKAAGNQPGEQQKDLIWRADQIRTQNQRQ